MALKDLKSESTHLPDYINEQSGSFSAGGSPVIIGLAAAKGERSPNSRNSFRCHLLYEQSRLLVVPRWFCCLGRREFPSRGCG